jgi:ABC-type glycerol-3-phosphate transport system permease component
LIAVAALWVLLPFHWAAITSFKLPVEVFKLAFLPWLQFSPTLQNSTSELTSRGSTIFQGLANSFIIGVGATPAPSP